MDEFRAGQAIRYKPGTGTYGYEDAVEPDGRIPGVVVNRTETHRIRVQLTIDRRRIGGLVSTITRCVDAASLIKASS